jgi:hypothetical protein
MEGPVVGREKNSGELSAVAHEDAAHGEREPVRAQQPAGVD